MKEYNICIIKPNKNSYSETFIQNHIDLLKGNKNVLYGGVFPVFDNEGNYIIKSKTALALYLFQKRLLRKTDIAVRNKALANYLKRHKIEVVLAEYGMTGAMVTEACRIAQVPLVIHFHGADAHHQPTVRKYQALYKRAFEYAAAIVVVSKDMYRCLQAMGAPASKLILNPYGVDIEKFTPVTISDSKNFIAVGRFVSKKAPLKTILAFKKVTELFKDAHLWMAGSGPLLSEAINKAQTLNIQNNITFTGIQSPQQIIALFQEMRCFVQHSVTADDGDMEGTPNTILEASACGLPVVATNHAGIKEAVINDVSGFLCNEYDVECMANYMIKLADSKQLAEKMGTAGRQHICENYNIKDQIAKLNNIICNVLIQ